ncbi:hypothetical protein [uncultured Stenotrophomonas sp.]|uniref:hypothetical protein n=1 Tax=uncultured Stenotrophomonas sp. TaxID=165438 RepID=UPI0025DA8EBB|nr:hypothetical protein [uncultured Stenotrophomonas sp.]
MTQIEAAIKNASEKIERVTQAHHARLLKEHIDLSIEIHKELIPLLNNLTRDENRNGQTVKVVRSSRTHEEWEAVFSVINMAAGPIVQLICEGLYLQAYCIVRQVLEGIAQLHHIRHGTRQITKAPQINHLDEALRRIYSPLSQGAHIATHDAAQIQAPSASGMESTLAFLPHGISLIPCYSLELSRDLLEIHLALRRLLLSHLQEHGSHL